MSEQTHSCCTDELNGNPDLIVVGAGSAGFAAAIRGAELGAQVALIGHGTIGGTCVNVGCVPSKTMIRAMEARHHADAVDRFAGLRGKASIDDWSALIAQKDELVSRLRQGKYIDLLPQYNNIAYVEGQARLTEDGVTVDGREVRSDRTVIATGSSPRIPNIPGMESVDYLTSTEALELARLPRSLLVVGGGYIGCELGQLFARAGVRVTIVCRSRLLPEAEPEISDALAGYLRDEGLVVRGGVSYRNIRAVADGIALAIESDEGAETLAAERVVLAVGRRPNADGMRLDEVGVARNSNGGIRVDDRLRTTNSRVYAAGDVTGRDQFVYMAAYGAKVAAENALNGNGLRYDATVMPSVVFTDPQVASVGLTEAAAREQGIEVKTSVLSLDHVPRALAARDTRGLIKLVAERETERLIGAHILAPEGGDSIQTAAMAMKYGATVSDLAQSIFPYLTTVEGLKLAALAFDKDVNRLSCCAG